MDELPNMRRILERFLNARVWHKLGPIVPQNLSRESRIPIEQRANDKLRDLELYYRPDRGDEGRLKRMTWLGSMEWNLQAGPAHGGQPVYTAYDAADARFKMKNEREEAERLEKLYFPELGG